MTLNTIPENTLNVTQQPILEAQALRKDYGPADNPNRVLDDVNFSINPGEFVCIVGPSGSGKTTLLRCIAGLLEPTAGTISLDQTPVTEPPEKLAVVFQDYSRSLLPWMTIQANLELPLKSKYDKAERAARVQEALVNVGLRDKGHLYPWQMSGGMQQRAAIARGLAYQPDVLLMDEPFAAVDAQTRIDLEDLVLQVRKKYDMTIVFVTHDIDEAVYLSDRIIVLSGAPTTVSHNVTVNLPSPRNQLQTKAEPRFAELRSFIFGTIQAAKQDA